ncbi:MAG: glutamine synthetase family protein [Pseudomonadota bacterium]
MSDCHEKIQSGSLVKAGVYSKEDIERSRKVIDALATQSVETIRLSFVDQHGILRGKTIVTESLVSILAGGLGMPSTLLLKDTAHKTVFPVWNSDVRVDNLALNGASDVLAVPDLNTLTEVPGVPHSRIMLCDLYDRHHMTAISFSSRQILRSATDALDQKGYQAVIGLEVEFQVFELVDKSCNHELATIPPTAVKTRNLTQGWQFLTETRYGEAEQLLDELRRAAEQMGLGVRTVEIEMGPSQFEFTFEPADPMTQADRYVLFRTMVKELCQRQRLHASFMAKPRLPNAAANGWHMHQSLLDKETGQNVFTPQAQDELTSEASGWIAGLLEHAAASCLLTTPTVNGYKRYGPYQLAPNRIAWGVDNRGAMVRALLYPEDPASRIENRVADSAVNPHFALAAQIFSGLDGIKRNTVPPKATASPYADDADLLPKNLIEAVEAFEQSAIYRDALGDGFVDYLAHIKRAEWERYQMTVSEWEQDEYFNLY